MLSRGQIAAIGECLQLFRLLSECKAIPPAKSKSLAVAIALRAKTIANDADAVIKEIPADVLDMFLSIETPD